jgi:hypothetical protein
MEAREFRVRLPADLPAIQYAAIVHAVAGVLDAAGLVSRSSIAVDPGTDHELNHGFDRFSADYPWSGR